MRLPIRLAFTIALFCAASAGAQLPPGHPPVAPKMQPPATQALALATQPATQPIHAELSDRLATTEHAITIDGQVLRYRARAGFMVLKSETGQELANFFFVAYDKIDPQQPAGKRPITFLFNGGPGAASVWLHLGTVGPYRLNYRDELGRPPIPPYELVQNDATWLTFTDLVFIDPVGTGFSRPAPGQKAEMFYNVKEDLESISDFVRLYLTEYERWLSPKFLAGESYGTTRAAALSEYLVDNRGIAINGAILVSPVLDFQTIQPDASNDLPYALYLPTYAAAAWFHKKLPPERQQLSLQQLLQQATQFALDDYYPALVKGSRLQQEQRQQLVKKLAEFSSVPPRFIEEANLRIDPGAFRKLLLKDEQIVAGRFDARLTGFELDPASSWPAYDPSLTPFLAAYTASFNAYVRSQLRFESQLPYEVLSNKVRFDFSQGKQGYLYVGDNLRSAMAKLPFMKVLVAAGYYDLATPFLASDYTIDHLQLSPELRGNITQTYYTAGHMMYHSREAMLKLKQDVANFVQSTFP